MDNKINVEKRSTKGRGQIYKSIIDTIGNTPCTKINNLETGNATVYVKSECFNPAGSVKDRLAISIIEDAEFSGALKPGQTVVEATSGNTGIGLAMICAAKGYPLVITMAESFSIERRKLMRFLGAKVVLTPKAEKGLGMYRKAKELANANGWFFAKQFETQSNADIHERTTAREIMSDFHGLKLDYWVSGYGTGGTVSGVGRVLRKERPDTRIILVEPENAALISSGIAQERTEDWEPKISHPAWQPHLIQGWTPDFIPNVLQETIDKKFYDEIMLVSSEAGIVWAQELAKKEGIITGISGGATFAVTMDVAKKAPTGSVILCMLPDTAERYMSSPLFENIESEMDLNELEISKSTPGFQILDKI
jgi:cysteine synthase A